jgi:hypothetical protein
MKKTCLLTIIIASSSWAQFLDAPQPPQEGVVISEKAATILKNNALSSTDRKRYQELKQTLYEAIKLAQKLPPDEANKIINSDYIKSVRKELKDYRKTITAINN